MLKKGTTPVLFIEMPINIEEIQKIIFTFRQKKDSVSEPVLHKTYPGEVQYDLEEKIFTLPLKQEDFLPFKNVFFLEGQIIFTGGDVEKTNILALEVSDTLYTEVV